MSEQHLVFSWVRGRLTLIGEREVVPERADAIDEYHWANGGIGWNWWIRPRPWVQVPSIACDPAVVVCTGTSPIATLPLPSQVSLLCLPILS